MNRSFPRPLLERPRAMRWAFLMLCLLVPSSLLRTAHNWQHFLHAASPIASQHHEEHHDAAHFDATDHAHATVPDKEHHRDHHAEHHDHSHDQALLSVFKWRPAVPQSLFMPPATVLTKVILPPARRELNPFGRDGPEAESPPAEHLSLPLAGRAPPVI